MRVHFGRRTFVDGEEIADHFGLTRERVRQIREKALRRLRGTSHLAQLKSYL